MAARRRRRRHPQCPRPPIEPSVRAAMLPSRYRPRRLTLRDGREVTLRAILESDAVEIVKAFERLSADSRYYRFMQHKRELDPRPCTVGCIRDPAATLRSWPRVRQPTASTLWVPRSTCAQTAGAARPASSRSPWPRTGAAAGSPPSCWPAWCAVRGTMVTGRWKAR